MFSSKIRFEEPFYLILRLSDTIMLLTIDIKTLVFSLDERTHLHISNYSSLLNDSKPSVTSYFLPSKIKIAESASAWREHQFNIMSILKMDGVSQVSST